MNIIHKNNPYGVSSNFEFDENYDYCLFRQDWNGSESVFFNYDEVDDLLIKIEEGEILIHPNYSVLFCKDEEAIKKVEGDFWVYAAIYNKNV
jgi:hypothetical protein